MFIFIKMFQYQEPPQAGHFHLNVDVGHDEVKGKFSIGAIVRDHFGNFVDAISLKIRWSSSVLGGELIAILKGLLLCDQYDIPSVSVFSDSLVAVQAVTASTDFFGPEAVLVNQIKSLLHGSSLKDFFICVGMPIWKLTFWLSMVYNFQIL